MKQYIKSITFLLSTTYLVSTSLTMASDLSSFDDKRASSTALVPFAMPSAVTTKPTVSKDLKVLHVAIGGKDAVTLLGAAEVRQGGRGATVTVSQTKSAPGVTDGGATLVVFNEDRALATAPQTTRVWREYEEAEAAVKAGKPITSDSLETSLLDAYSGKKEVGDRMLVEHTPVPLGEGDGGGSTITRRSYLEIITPGFLDFRTALDRFTNEQVVLTLRGLSEAIKTRMAGYGQGIVNDSLRVAMPLIDKTLSFLDDATLMEALQYDMSLILPALDKIVDSCDRYIRKKRLPLDPPPLDDVILEGVSITDLHAASLQIERVLYMIKDNKFMNKQKVFMRNVIEKTKTSAPSSDEGKLNKAFREGLAELDALHAMFTSHKVPAFEHLREGIIQINLLSEGIIRYAQPTHRIAMAKAAEHRWVQDFKDQLAITDKPAREVTSALVLSRATPKFVTDSTRLSALASEWGYGLNEKRFDFKHTIANAARYASVPALVDGVVVEPLALTDAVPTMPSDGGSGGSVSGLVTAEVPTGGKASGSADESKKG
ncbi:MAG: hypothetical protein K2Q34_02515 [Alphaproteobacteria bacterium]|nr:hypothetical protein [Alphaproteobacteria bacterium]